MQAALACGLSAEDLRQLIDEESADKDSHGGTLGQAWNKVPTMKPGPSELADRTNHDILSPQPIPRSQPAPVQLHSQTRQAERAPAADEMTAEAVQDGGKESAGGPSQDDGVMSRRQLKRLAERRGLDYDLLLADAAAQGVELSD